MGIVEGLLEGEEDGNSTGVVLGLAEGVEVGVSLGYTEGLLEGEKDGMAVGVSLGFELGLLVGQGVPPLPLPFPLPLDGGTPSTHVGGGTVGLGVGSTQFPHPQQVNGQVSFTSALSQYLLILSILDDSHPHRFLSFTPGLATDSLLISKYPLVSWQSSSARHNENKLRNAPRKMIDVFISLQFFNYENSNVFQQDLLLKSNLLPAGSTFLWICYHSFSKKLSC